MIDLEGMKEDANSHWTTKEELSKHIFDLIKEYCDLEDENEVLLESLANFRDGLDMVTMTKLCKETRDDLARAVNERDVLKNRVTDLERDIEFYKKLL